MFEGVGAGLTSRVERLRRATASSDCTMGGGRLHAQRWRARLHSSSLLVVQQAAVDLVDEIKHDERAGPGHGHHDEAVHNGHSTSISQQAALVSVDWAACCARFAAHKAGGRQAHDEQLQQRSGRREGRVQHVRAHELAQSLRAPRAGTTTDIAIARNVRFYSHLNKFILT